MDAGNPSPPWAEPNPWAAHVVDVFVYVVILNLTAEFVPAVVTESFSMSLLTALLLKAVLTVVLALKQRFLDRLRNRESVLGRIVPGVGLALLMPGSKLVVLELVALVFGDAISLGGFWSVTALVIVLSLAQLGVRRLLRMPSPPSDLRASAEETR